MNVQDFDLLTQEEINAVVAEVLQDAGIRNRVSEEYEDSSDEDVRLRADAEDEADSIDPEKVGASLYVRGGKSGYQKLTAAARTAILNGEGRL